MSCPGDAVAGLLDLDNSVADAAALTEQPEAEVRRLHKLAARSASAAAEDGADANGCRPAEARCRDGEGQSTLDFDSDAASAATAPAEWAPGPDVAL
jgi:hypothetical protein